MEFIKYSIDKYRAMQYNMNKCSYERRSKNIIMYDEDVIENGCPNHTAHPEVPLRISERLPSEEEMYNLAELFKLFGDSTRIRILCALMERELCVCQIADTLKMTQSAISHQLRVLKQGSLVKFRREGKTIFYSLRDDHVRTIISQGIDHVEE